MNVCEFGCEQRWPLKHGWCEKHYQRWRRLGTPHLPERTVNYCTVDGCSKRVRRNGLCNTHSTRYRKHGDPLHVERIQGDDPARFMQYVAVNPDGCWIWTGVKHKTRNYGRFWVGGRGGRYIQAHRWSYEHHVAPIPRGLTIDHLCMVRECVNPDHLEPVTQAENNRRAARANRKS
jgi:hypothetical protein